MRRRFKSNDSFRLFRRECLAGAVILAALGGCAGDADLELLPDAAAPFVPDPSPENPEPVPQPEPAPQPEPVPRPQPGAPITNTPTTNFVNTSAIPGDRFVIETSNLFAEDFSSASFVSWYAELRNIGDAPLCGGLIESIALVDGNGAELATLNGVLSGPPYSSVTNLPRTCIPAGERGYVHALEQFDAPVAMASVTTVRFAIAVTSEPAATRHPLAPTIVDVALQSTPQGQRARGTLRNDSGQPIHNIGLRVFVRGSDGYIVDELSATHLDTLPVSASWSYETTTYTQGRLSELVQFERFLPGPRQSLRANKTISSVENQRRDRHALLLSQRRALRMQER